MSYSHFNAVLFALFLYGFLGLACFGWGKVFMFMLSPTRRDQECTPATFTIWIGWAFTLFVFQLIHFVLPLTFLSVGPIFFIGIVLSVFFLSRQYRRKVKTSQSRTAILYHSVTLSVLSVLLLTLSVWLASRSMLPASDYDSGLYHFNAVRWINSFPIIPGFGNLHGRLAFNQSFFSYVEALNFYPLFGHGRSIANSFLWLLSFLTLFEVILPVLRDKCLFGKSSPLQWATALFCVPSLVYWALSSRGIQSPSPDLTSSLLQMVIFVIFCRIVAAFADDFNISRNDSVILLFLGATTITIKLSNLAFCGTIMLLTFVLSVRTSKRCIADSARLLLFPTLVYYSVLSAGGLCFQVLPCTPRRSDT